ncbi:MAG: adenylyl-sulfate kinase [Gemmatimonadetes bacterium]|nr:adenylyl-sulfate kinase [Gemmatimonadota bacterium]
MAGRQREARRPFVLWLTGLSGSGKSTIADRVYETLKDRGIKVERLDGDEIRSVFPDTGFDRSGRMAHIARVGYLASVLERNGISTIVSLISPYREARENARQGCGRFIEVHISTPLEVCEARDVKGLYAKSRRGEIEGFTGIGDPYEAPERPELVIDTSRQTVGESVAAVMRHIEPLI